MSRSIELPDEIYQDLERVAQQRGLSVAGWIAANLPPPGPMQERPLSRALQGLLGVVDSAKEPRNGYARTPFSNLVARKLEGQGLRRP
ncbi:MAG TPA: hypothetical protein VKM93_18135 [Terriglobia bacterium]|nr:hypothetical protein [Terriglobia bacterium]